VSGAPKIGGCKRGPDDQRDFILLCGVGKELPKSIDLRSLCSPVENQRRLNSCTANACVGAMEMLEKKQDLPQQDLSRLYVYYNTRLLEGSVYKDQGAYISTSMKAIKKYGACLESMWPYKPSDVFTRPGNECYADGDTRQSVEYARVGQGYGILAALADGFPVAFGMMLYPSFSRIAGRTGVARPPSPKEPPVGGHAMLIVGYDMEISMYIVRNSWGTKWGKGGYCYIPCAMVNNPNMSWDFWAIRSIEEPEDTYEIFRPQ